MSLIIQLIIELISLPFYLKAIRRSDTMPSGVMLIMRKKKDRDYDLPIIVLLFLQFNSRYAWMHHDFHIHEAQNLIES